MKPDVAAPPLSVVIPMCDESRTVPILLAQVVDALHDCPHEIVVVDDGSRDGTGSRLAEARSWCPGLRLATHEHRRGQTAALRCGVRLARAPLIATLDGDGQDDPAEIPALLRAFREDQGQPPLGLVSGHRPHRSDSRWRCLTSRVANRVRGRVLGDGAPDSGCGLKVFRRSLFLELPAFDHMHRFLPALVARAGYRAISLPVRHRPRASGHSHYGTWDRLRVGLPDLLGVLWLMRRPCPDACVEEGSDEG